MQLTLFDAPEDEQIAAEKRAKRAEYMRGWMARNREKARATCRASQEKHREKRRSDSRASYYKDREKRLAAVKAYQGKNKEARTAYYQEWRNSEAGKAARANAEHRRRAKKKNCPETATTKEVMALLASAIRCHYCEVQFGDDVRPTIDHMVPLSKGGPHRLDNLVAACLRCNTVKGTRLPEEFQPRNFTT